MADYGLFPALDDGLLLDGMGQFVCKQCPAFFGLRAVLATAEENMVSVRKGAGAESRGQTVRGFVGMYFHATEVGTETRLHELTHVDREWRPGCRARLDVAGCFRIGKRRIGFRRIDGQSFLRALDGMRHALRLCRGHPPPERRSDVHAAGRCFPSGRCGRRHLHDARGHRFCFPLRGVHRRRNADRPLRPKS